MTSFVWCFGNFHINFYIFQMGEALNMKWTSACGSPLTEENLHYLACKAFRNNTLPKDMEEVNKFHLSWSLFCKEDLPGRDFTFWEWFLKILVLTQCHLASLWKEGLVKGCISKESAESMLKDKPAGTFLLRFSDSLLGGVTIAYAGQPGCKYDNISSEVKRSVFQTFWWGI